MILEVAILNVRPGEGARFEETFAQAQSIIASMPGYLAHELQRCMEAGDRYVLLVQWRSLEDHTEGFRGSPQYQEWKRVLHPFYDPFPTVEHYERVNGGAEPVLAVDGAGDHKARVIEEYFRCVVEGRLDDLPVTPDYGSESPLSGRKQGADAIAYLGEIGKAMRDIRIVRHIVEGDGVATHFEEVLAGSVLPVVGLFEFEDDRIRFVRVFFDNATAGT
jgi:heme-degrading monooxygenase HmoA